jgi:hypothetical protein
MTVLLREIAFTRSTSAPATTATASAAWAVTLSVLLATGGLVRCLARRELATIH